MISYHSSIQIAICLPQQLSITTTLFTHHNFQFFWQISVLFCPPPALHQLIWLNLNSLSLCQAPIKTLPAGCSSPRCIYVILYDILQVYTTQTKATRNPNYGHQFIRKSKRAADKFQIINAVANFVCVCVCVCVFSAMKVKTKHNSSGCHKCHIDRQSKYNKTTEATTKEATINSTIIQTYHSNTHIHTHLA